MSAPAPNLTEGLPPEVAEQVAPHMERLEQLWRASERVRAAREMDEYRDTVAKWLNEQIAGCSRTAGQFNDSYRLGRRVALEDVEAFLVALNRRFPAVVS